MPVILVIPEMNEIHLCNHTDVAWIIILYLWLNILGQGCYQELQRHEMWINPSFQVIFDNRAFWPKCANFLTKSWYTFLRFGSRTDYNGVFGLKTIKLHVFPAFCRIRLDSSGICGKSALMNRIIVVIASAFNLRLLWFKPLYWMVV